MSRVLIIVAHPALHRSRMNRAMLAAAGTLPGVTVHDLYERYPDFHIAVDYEQKLLREHHALVFQHPLYWYSCPALLKEWQDVVLEHGFAWGEKGTALTGKPFLSAITTGANESTYSRSGLNHYTIPELLTPFEQTARFCGMHPLPPFVVHASAQLTREQAAAAAADYRTLIESLHSRAHAAAAGGNAR